MDQVLEGCLVLSHDPLNVSKMHSFFLKFWGSLNFFSEAQDVRETYH